MSLLIGGFLFYTSPDPAQGQCLLAGSNVLSVTAVGATFINGDDPRLLGFADGCRLVIHPNGGVATFGIEIEASLPSTLPSPVTVDVKFQSNEGAAAPVELHLRRAGQIIGSFDLVTRWSLEADGTTDKTIDLTALAGRLGADISEYIHPGNRLVFRLMGFPVMTTGGNCDESFEFDRGG